MGWRLCRGLWTELGGRAGHQSAARKDAGMDLSCNSPPPPQDRPRSCPRVLQHRRSAALRQYGISSLCAGDTSAGSFPLLLVIFFIGVPPGKGGRHPEALHERPQAGFVPAAGLVSGGDVSGQGQADASVAGCEDE